mgnify:CR=1 FL=1
MSYNKVCQENIDYFASFLQETNMIVAGAKLEEEPLDNLLFKYECQELNHKRNLKLYLLNLNKEKSYKNKLINIISE